MIQDACRFRALFCAGGFALWYLSSCNKNLHHTSCREVKRTLHGTRISSTICNEEHNNLQTCFAHEHMQRLLQHTKPVPRSCALQHMYCRLRANFFTSASTPGRRAGIIEPALQCIVQPGSVRGPMKISIQEPSVQQSV